MKHPLQEMMDKRRQGIRCGIPSYCSANELVIEIALRRAKERNIPVLIEATANQVNELPAELLRKGRFDEIFFVDLPDTEARADVLKVHLAKRGLQAEDFDLDTLVEAAQGFSGAEIEQAIVSALYTAHAEQKPLDTPLLLQEIHGTRPLSVIMAEQVTALRAWARERTVPAD